VAAPGAPTATATPGAATPGAATVGTVMVTVVPVGDGHGGSRRPDSPRREGGSRKRRHQDDCRPHGSGRSDLAAG